MDYFFGPGGAVEKIFAVCAIIVFVGAFLLGLGSFIHWCVTKKPRWLFPPPREDRTKKDIAGALKDLFSTKPSESDAKKRAKDAKKRLQEAYEAIDELPFDEDENKEMKERVRRKILGEFGMDE